MQRLLGMVLAVLVLGTPVVRAADTEAILETPDSYGDQVIYYYDTRPDFTTFITLRNSATIDDVTVNILFYGPTFGTPFSKSVTLGPRRLTVIDVGALRGEGLPAQAGVALATAVDESGRPIATGALAGNFTVANLLTGSAFGAAAAGRPAVNADGAAIPVGTIIGVDTGVLEPIRQSSALLAGFYDPATLAPASAGGNQLIFINFRDTYAPTYGATSGSTTWSVDDIASSGVEFPETTFTVNGVTVTDLASVLGPGVDGAAASFVFRTEPGGTGLTRLVYFTESLGTFGTGYLLPPEQFRPRNSD